MRCHIIHIRSSVGEVEWILPLALKFKELGDKVIFLFDGMHQYKRLEKDFILNEIFTSEFKDLTYIRSRYYLFFPRSLRFFFKKFKLPGSGKIIQFVNYLEFLFLEKTINYFEPRCKDNKYYFYTDYNGSDPYSELVKAFLPNTLIIYFPHSPHIFGCKASLVDGPAASIGCKRDILLLGSEADFLSFKDLADNLVFFIGGHTRYSDFWISKINYYLDKHSSNPSKALVAADETSLRVLLVSRGVGYISKDNRMDLINLILRSIRKLDFDIMLNIKIHPRESKEQWLGLLEAFSIKAVFCDDNVMYQVAKSDCVITLWSSVALDSIYWGRPVLEVADPQVSSEIIGMGCNNQTTYKHLNVCDSVTSSNDICDFLSGVHSQELKINASIDVIVKKMFEDSKNSIQNISNFINTYNIENI